MNNWVEYNGYTMLNLSDRSAFVEEVDSRWHWQVDKPELDDAIWAGDEIFNFEELDGWWGFKDTKEEAQQAAERALLT